MRDIPERHPRRNVRGHGIGCPRFVRDGDGGGLLPARFRGARVSDSVKYDSPSLLIESARSGGIKIRQFDIWQ